MLCIEGFHCLSNVDAFLSGAHSMMNEGGSLVIADTFEKSDLEKVETKFALDHEFFIHKKEVITFNVRHAMQLDKPKIEKLIQRIPGATMNKVVHRIFRNFLSSGEQSKTFEDLGKTKEYICYVLKRKQDAVQQTALHGKPHSSTNFQLQAVAGLFSPQMNIR